MLLDIITNHAFVQGFFLLCVTLVVLVPYTVSSIRKSSELEFNRELERKRLKHQHHMLEKGTMIEHGEKSNVDDI